MIDNRRLRLAERVRGLLEEGAVGARFAVGYLFLEGLAPLRDEIAHLDDVQILIGNVVNRLTDEQVREEADARRRAGETSLGEMVRDQEDLAAGLRETHSQASALTGLNLRRTLAEMEHSPENQSLLLTIAQRIVGGHFKVRVYTQGRIHAKLTLLTYADKSPLAIVGSSNLTLAGPGHPTEMNVIVRDEANVAALAVWYQEIWEASQDFQRELFEEIGQCWAMQSPNTNSDAH
ncbi:MAG: phospholipase D-like domain-containing protein [Armatimonadota bacterium]|nr:phospholipase D-like domain-containing protein [Armatimonadota bacterium]